MMGVGPVVSPLVTAFTPITVVLRDDEDFPLPTQSSYSDDVHSGIHDW